MYRIAKTLNHNSFIGVEEESNQEYLVMGKGIAFGERRRAAYAAGRGCPRLFPYRDYRTGKCKDIL